MSFADIERAAALYLPLTVALVARVLDGRHPRQFAACLLSALWTAPTLVLLQRWNEHALWWSFPDASGVTFRGMPLELYLGWILLWGVVPRFALRRQGVLASAAVLLTADCLLMPAAKAVVTLHHGWWIGEAVGLALVLLPALCLGRWTEAATHLRGRAALQLALAGLLFLFLFPEIIFDLRPGQGWMAVGHLPGWSLQLSLQAIFLLAIPGISAVMEFAERGRGTPIPYDPPSRLVTSGVYRYCANPMQVSCTLVMFAWSALLRSGWMAVAACVSIAYCAGIAEWDERQDLGRRFQADWTAYRAAVSNWWPRWRPYHAGPPALLYLAEGCGVCCELRAWLERQHPLGLQILDAETLPAGSIERMRYDPGDASDTVDGVRAMGRALEHLHLGWALGGAAMRLPGMWQVIQLFLDASGFGPRQIQSRPVTRHP